MEDLFDFLSGVHIDNYCPYCGKELDDMVEGDQYCEWCGRLIKGGEK